ncbi:MAG TPA: AIM24 family protein, partial [Chloroflexi bacterium]|nr:AIM24 family protein [Chloroflexota bacterium]
MRYELHGTVMQSLDVHLTRGEAVYTESGGMAWMRGNVEMKTNTKGGLLKGLGRALAGESLFMTTYGCVGEQCMVTFTPEAPGKVLAFPLQAGQHLICQRDAFMCAEDSVGLEMHFNKKLGAGLFGGEGFILQKISGPGHAFLEIPGEVREYTLQAGEQLRVDPG